MLYEVITFMFGYAKPVPINPMNFKKPQQGMAISAAAGPVTNIMLAFASFLIMNVLIPLASLLPATLAETVLMPLILRITSYNVCYTKLLREQAIPY